MIQTMYRIHNHTGLKNSKTILRIPRIIIIII